MNQDRKTLAISEIVKIIEECRYNDELAQGYKREKLDQEKVYEQRGKRNTNRYKLQQAIAQEGLLEGQI